ncbi:MAG: thioredoxin family protein [Bacteroidia bacterium]
MRIFSPPYAYHDLEEGLAAAKEQQKPIFLYFGCYACMNSRKQIKLIEADHALVDFIKENFVIISLQVDDRTKLPESRIVESKHGGRKIRTFGRLWSGYQTTKFQTGSQHSFGIMNHQEEVFQVSSYNPDMQSLFTWFEEGLEKVKKIKVD